MSSRYRIDLLHPPADALERLITLGALDVESQGERIAALMPDTTDPESVAAALDVTEFVVSPAVGRDDGSVWTLSPRVVRAGRLTVVPAHLPATAGALRLLDRAAFGTGLHPTTALCLEIIEELIDASSPDRMLDVGTGSGVLALAALMHGVHDAVGVDIAPEALRAAEENAQLNGMSTRLRLVLGGPDVVDGQWPLVVANVLSAPLCEMAPMLVRRLGRGGRLVLSGIAETTAPEVQRVYCRLGLRHERTGTRGGWCAMIFGATW